jgi:hypothetical protein
MVDKKKDGKNLIASAIGEAARKLEQLKPPDDPAPQLARDDALPGRWTADKLGLPRESPCPVVPLGIENGVYHLMDSCGQHRELRGSDFTHSTIQDLFALTPNWPLWAAPRWGRPPTPEDPPPLKSFEDDRIRVMLMHACSLLGQFSAKEKLRGRGAWRLAQSGGLVYHAGRLLWRCELKDGVPFFRCEPPGWLEGRLYAVGAGIPGPWDQPLRLHDPTDNPAGPLLQTLRCWNWEKPEIDPVLLLGWIGVAFLGAALPWRSAVVLLGDRGTGKSTLQRGLKDLFGDALFSSADTSAAGIYQNMRHDARPVAVDELEAGADNRKVDAVINLMRGASSGSMQARGGADHKPVEFQMHSAFLFSAINNPLQSSQDLSRVAILRLRELDPAKPKPPAIDADVAGRKILARLMAQWHRFDELFELYAGALVAGGHKGRGGDTYGTLLAVAEMMLGAELAAELAVPLSEDLNFWTENLAAHKLPEIQDAVPNWEACLAHLFTVPVPQWRNGARATIGQLVGDLHTPGLELDVTQIRRELAAVGLGLMVPGENFNLSFGHILAIPNRSAALSELFRGTPWGGSGGEGGPWKDALRQGPDAIVLRDVGNKDRMRIGGGKQVRCSLVSLKHYFAHE